MAAALLVAVLVMTLLAVITSAVDPAPADVVTEEVRRRLADPAAQVDHPREEQEEEDGCREVVVTDEYGITVPVRECPSPAPTPPAPG